MTEPTWPTERDDDAATVRVAGEIDLALAPSLRDHLAELVANGVRSLKLNTEDVSFIDSVGLSVLVAINRSINEANGHLTIVAPSRVMSRTLEIAGLLETLDITG